LVVHELLLKESAPLLVRDRSLDNALVLVATVLGVGCLLLGLLLPKKLINDVSIELHLSDPVTLDLSVPGFSLLFDACEFALLLLFKYGLEKFLVVLEGR